MATITQVPNGLGPTAAWEDFNTWDLERETRDGDDVVLFPDFFDQAVTLNSDATVKSVTITLADPQSRGHRMGSGAKLTIHNGVLRGAGSGSPSGHAAIDNVDGTGSEEIIFAGEGGTATILDHTGSPSNLIKFTGTIRINNWVAILEVSENHILTHCVVQDSLCVWEFNDFTPTFIGRVLVLNSLSAGRLVAGEYLQIGGQAGAVTPLNSALELTCLTGGRGYGTHSGHASNSGLQFSSIHRLRDNHHVARRERLSGVHETRSP